MDERYGFNASAPQPPCPHCNVSLSYPSTCSCNRGYPPAPSVYPNVPPANSVYPNVPSPEHSPGPTAYPYPQPGAGPYPGPPNLPPSHKPSYPRDAHYPPTNTSSGGAYRWIDSSAYGGVPPTAVQGGADVDGHPIYVGRAFFEGDWIPAKVIPGKQAAYVAHGGHEHLVHQFQILCEQRFQWVPAYGGTVPHDAVQGGNTSEGEPLYIGRAWHEGSQTIGKVHPSHGCCYIPFDGEEVRFDQYEILVLRT